MKITRETILLCLAPLLRNTVAASGGECIDMNGRTIAPGIHYVPGPDTCTLCECENGSPKWCKAVLCSPPQDCKSFRVGNSCCEFICLDDTLPKSDGNPEMSADMGLRLIASAIAAILSLSLLLFLVHRLRQRKIRGRQNRQMSEDERSLGNIHYMAGSIGYLPGSMGYLSTQEQIDFPYSTDPRANFALWKPPEHYFPRGEAPPPYEEAVAAAQAEAMASAMSMQGTSSVTVSSVPLTVSLPPMCDCTAGMSTSASSTPLTVSLPPICDCHPNVASSSGTLRRNHREQLPLPSADIIPTLSSLPPPPELPSDLQVDFLHAIRSDAFYEDVPLPPPPSQVEYVNVEQTRAPHLAGTSYRSAGSLRHNLAMMNDLNKSTCSCPDDNDDYRSECENCKSTHGSRYLDPEPNITPQETMTLQRRPPSLTPNTASGYGTSHTLPSQSRLLRDQSRGVDLSHLPPFSVQIPPPHWSDSSSSSRSPSPEQLRRGGGGRAQQRPRRSSVSSEGLETSTHM